jgi:hypothetical protein
MAITYIINNFNNDGTPTITYPFNSCSLTANGDGASDTLIVPLAQYPFRLPINEKNSPGVSVTASSPLSSFSLDPNTLDLTIIWPNAGAAGGPVEIQVVYTSF